MEDVSTWFSSVRLKLNTEKTELMFVSPRSTSVDAPSSVVVSGESVAVSTTIKTLGFIFDSNMLFEKQISSVCSSCFYHLRRLWSVRRSISMETCNMLARTLILSRLDYCNSL